MLRRTFAFIALILGALVIATPASAEPVAFGVHTPNDPFGGGTPKVDALEHDIGRRVAIVSWFQNWGGEDWVSRVHPHVFNAVIAGDRLPLVTWEPWTPRRGPNQPRFALRRIVDGAFDDYIAMWARDLAALQSPIYLRPMHEFNGNWYPWSGTVNGNSPRLFKRAWIRMHEIFSREGAANVKWVFSPLNEDWPMTAENRFERYYPGRQYVDVLALDGYNWGAHKPQWGGWRSFRSTFSSAYRRLARLGPQPIWIAEVGSATEGGSKAAWVRDMFRRAHSMRRLKAVVWMDSVEADGGDWRIRSPLSVAAAFAPSPEPVVRALGALKITKPLRAGMRAVLRWSAMGVEDDVERWRVYLNGRKVRALLADRRRILRTRIGRAGRFRFTVRGIDAQGETIVTSSRNFRVLRAR